ncbi:hypothetical protein B0I35DRAFT_407152 [Stachybotrys elegans]|uniref:Uncharacterized protein n=1 Tax=Stachybotrys elegans TaxID=80388 RepID=A0A8K0SVM3_9HYPO|nr:hypothetical protein B0I35DRAFT_407152 [Stachybotrys elegans]
MPTPEVDYQTINVEEGVLPYPATKLIITQYLHTSLDPLFWGWILVAAFFDAEDNIIWSTEVFAAHLDIQFESDEEDEGDEEESVYQGSSDQDASEPESVISDHQEPRHISIRDFDRSSTPDLEEYQPFPSPDIEHHPTLQTPTYSYYGAPPRIETTVLTMSSGWNPLIGRDGSNGPGFQGAATLGPNQAYIPHGAGPGYSFGWQPYHHPWANVTYGTTYIGATGPPTGYPAPQEFSYQPNGAGNVFARGPQGYPGIDPTMPAAQMGNSSGGTGCEPGYNYFFPADHTKVHVFRSDIAPWRMPAHAQVSFSAVHIPCSTTLAELLKGFGCTNPVPKKNRCYEIMSGGGGRWYKGLEVSGADKDMMRRAIRDLGWDQTRSGRPGEKPVVCLWFVKN